MLSVSRTPAGTLAVALAVLLAASSHAASLRGWRDGPAGELLSDEEYRAFGELRNDAQRKVFIDDFWRTMGGGAPGTSYRQTFERRCAEANERFVSPGQEGWKTERGRVFVALGEPSTIQQVDGGVSSIDREIWTYESGPPDDGTLRMVFYRCADRNYRLDPSCGFHRDPTSVSFDDERAAYVQRVRESNPAIASGRLLGMMAGLLRPVPGGVPAPRAPVAGSTLSTGVLVPPLPAAAGTPGTHALENASYFFRAQDGSVLTLLSVELLKVREEPPAAREVNGPPFVGAVSVQEATRNGEPIASAAPRTIALDVASPARAGSAGSFFARVYFEAGKTYAVRFAVKDQARDEILVRNAVVGVPDLARGFAASSIVPAEQFGPADGSSGFQIGSEEVVPKAGGVFRHSELLRLYLQVYDAAIDERTSRPRVDVVFRFYRTVKGRSKRYGKPFPVRGAAGASMGLALPIGDWPAGPYRVEVDLHDRVAEQRILAEGSFSIAVD